MRFSTTALVLCTLAAGQAAAASISHEHMPGKRHNHAARHAEIMKSQEHRAAKNEKRDTSALSATGSALVGKLGFAGVGLNPTSQGNTPWIGDGGTFTNEFFNQGSDDLVLTIWGSSGSWVNAVVPQITVSLAPGASQTISFPVGWSGAWAGAHSETKMVNGQISDTWGEGTFVPKYSVVDVSREVNLNGRSMSIVGPTCTSDMNTCVFKCGGGAVTCLTGYELVNCATGSQEGANFGTYNGAPSGGCGGMGDSANLKTYLG